MEIVSFHGPNQVEATAAGADTSWHQLTLPTSVPAGNLGITVAITVLNAANTAAGSMAFVAFNEASTFSGTGFPIQPGQTLVFGKSVNIFYKLGSATDNIFFLFSF